MPAMPLSSYVSPCARNRRATVSAMLFGTGTVTGAIGSSRLTCADAARSAPQAGRPYVVVLTGTANQLDNPLDPA